MASDRTSIFNLGEVARLRAKFFRKITNAPDMAANPTTATVFIKDPNGKVTTKVFPTDPEVVQDGVGNFHIDQLGNIAGEWHHRWEGAGAVTSAAERKFTVRASVFGSLVNC